MSSIQSNPRITTLNRNGTMGWERWTILAENPIQGFTALHEFNETGSVSEITQRVRLTCKLEVDIFCNKLELEGWSQCATPSRYKQSRMKK
jgi:hypothetical protein